MKKTLSLFILILSITLTACNTDLTNAPADPAEPGNEAITEAEQLDAQLELASAIAEESMALEDGDEVSVDLYEGDPEEGGTLLASDSFIKGEERLRDVVKDLKDANPAGDYIVVSANGESRTISLADAKRHMKKRAIAAILGDLEDGTEVALELYHGHPDNDGTAVVNNTYIVGESSFREALKSLIVDSGDEDITHLKISVGDEMVITPLPKKLTSDLGKFLAGLNQGDEVTIILYNGDPADGGEELVSATYEIGEGYFMATLKALRKNAGRGSHTHMSVSANGESITVELGKGKHKGR